MGKKIEYIEHFNGMEPAIEIFKNIGYINFRDIQIKAMDNGVFDDITQLVFSPSGSGKTLIGELAIVSNALTTYRKTVYLVPLRSLADEKYNYFLKSYKNPLKAKIVMAVGDMEVSTSELQEADILIFTYEKFDYYLRNEQYSFFGKSIGTIIIDEIHLLGDSHRGARLENLIISIYNLEYKPQIIGLSATVGNPGTIISWFNHLEKKFRNRHVNSIVNTKRPIDLNHNIIEIENQNRKFSRMTKIIKQTIENQGQVLVFTNSRKKTEMFSDQLLDDIGIINVIKYNLIGKSPDAKIDENDSNSRKRTIETSLTQFKNEIEREFGSISPQIFKNIKEGVSFHHAGLSSADKKAIEIAFKEGFIKVIFTTSTLSAGVNLPARVVIMEDFHIYDVKNTMKNRFTIHTQTFHKKPINNNMFHQICGRAGRPGFDPIGTVYILVKDTEEALYVKDKYFRYKKQEKDSLIPFYEDIKSNIPLNRNILEELLLMEISKLSNEQMNTYFDITNHMVEYIQNSLMWQELQKRNIPIEAYLNFNILDSLTMLKAFTTKIDIMFLKQLQIDLSIHPGIDPNEFSLELRYQLNINSNFINMIREKELRESDTIKRIYVKYTDIIKNNKKVVHNLKYSSKKEIQCSCNDNFKLKYELPFLKYISNDKNSKSNSYRNKSQNTHKLCLDFIVLLWKINEIKSSNVKVYQNIDIYELEKTIYRSLFSESIINTLVSYKLIKEEKKDDIIFIENTELGEKVYTSYIFPKIGYYLHRELTNLIGTKSTISNIQLFQIINKTMELQNRKNIPDKQYYRAMELLLKNTSIPKLLKKLRMEFPQEKIIYTSDFMSIIESTTRILRFIHKYIQSFYPNFVELPIAELFHKFLNFRKIK